MKRKIKVHGKVKLYEASAVGLPAYPDAHANVDSFSLIKALTNASLSRNTGFVEESADIIEPTKVDELNSEEKEAMVENESNTPTETEEKVALEQVASESEKKVDVEVKPEMTSEIAKAIAEGIKAGFKELETNRGIVDKQVPVKKSLGEITMEMHNSAYGLNR